VFQRPAVRKKTQTKARVDANIVQCRCNLSLNDDICWVNTDNPKIKF